MRLKRCLLPLFAGWLVSLTGCTLLAGEKTMAGEVKTLQSRGQCGFAQAGLHLVTGHAQWERLPFNQQRFGGSLPDPLETGRWVLLIAQGRKPTPGYGLTLTDSRLTGKTLEIRVAAHSPAPGQAMAQMITTPCLILSIPRNGWQQLRVSGAGETNWQLSHP